jgi:two-component system sensor histidine kinase PilS (NtrC family)
MGLRAEEVSGGGVQRRWVWWLIAGRVLAAAVVFGASALWWGGATGAREETGRLVGSTTPIAIAVLSLSVVYALVLRFTRVRPPAQAGAQLAIDAVLITWLVLVTGNLYSMLAIASGWLDRAGAALTTASLAKAVEAVGLNDVAFLFVGLLAAQLAVRQTRSEVEMREAANALASLRALHERIVESIRSGVITTDLQRRVYTVNRAAEEMTGYSSEDLRGKDVSILFGDIRGQIEQSLRAAEEGNAAPRFEAECLTPEGFRARLGYGVSPLYSEGGETTGLVITFQDLTDIRSMEETSRRQERLSAVGRVAAGIAHEIRNPLAAMRGSIQVLKSDMQADASQAELMDIVLRESDRLNRIITDFLTYARPRKFSLVETDLREPLRETFALLRHSPEILDGHTLEEDLPEEPLMAMADAEGVRQVFWNLSRNALKAMPEGGTLRAEMRHASGERVRVTFTDTGRGMSPAQVERLFEPFSSSTTGGTGLGLSIVYQIIRDHGGTINVRSREGHGTTITIELPAKQS